MERRKLLAKAGVVTVTAFAATLAFGATFGLADRTEPDSPVGRLDESKGAVARSTAPPTAVSVTTHGLGPGADD
jgi:hypothetical protein